MTPDRCGDGELALRTHDGMVEIDADGVEGVMQFDPDEATALGWHLLKRAEDARGAEE